MFSPQTTGQSWISWSPAVSQVSTRGPPLCHKSDVVGPPLCHMQVLGRLYCASTKRLYTQVSWISWSPCLSQVSTVVPLCHQIGCLGLYRSAVLVASTVPRLNDSTRSVSMDFVVPHCVTSLNSSVPLCHIQVGCLWSPSLQSSSPLLCLD